MRRAMVVAAYGLVACGSMARRCLGAAGWCAALLLIVVYTAAPAAAQNTVNQTTCGGLSGVGSCLTNGFLQDLAVDCASTNGIGVSTALAQITDRNGPNRIRLSGGNCGGFRIVGFNRLTIEGDGSPLGGFWGFAATLAQVDDVRLQRPVRLCEHPGFRGDRVQVFGSCPANKFAIGAGYQLGNLHYLVRVNRPNAATTAAGAPRGWVLQIYNTANTRQTGPITLDVLCAFAQ